MSDLIRRGKVIEEIKKYEYELRKFKKEANESGEIQKLFALANQEIAICKIKRNILNMPAAYDIDKVVEELKADSSVKLYGSGNSGNYLIPVNRVVEIVKHGGVTDDVCEWKYNDTEYCLESSCNHLQIFMDDCPKQNEYSFCPYCGKKIKVVE